MASGVAPLGADGKVASTYLPSYVDDVLEFSSLSGFPATGESGKIYVATDTGKIYRWGGTSYIEISPSPGSTDSVPEGSTNLYFTTARAASAAPVQSVNGKSGAVALTKADVGLGNVDNTSDANKPISTATQSALNGKQNALGYTPVNKAGDTMTGPLTAPGINSANTATISNEIYAAYPIWTSSGFQYHQHQTAHVAYIKKTGGYDFYWRRNDTGLAGGANEVQLMTLDDNGNLSVLGSINTAGHAIWHAGNFNPDSKASLAVANTFTDQNPIIMSNGGNQVNQFNVGDRTGWYDVAGSKDIWFYTFATKWLTLNGNVTANGTLTTNQVFITGLGDGLFSNGTGIQYNGAMYFSKKINVLSANSAAWVAQPRVFVQSGDPGDGAADGDLWIW
jgi:hypothetical protein